MDCADVVDVAVDVGAGPAPPRSEGAGRKSTTAVTLTRVSRLYPFTTPTDEMEKTLLSVEMLFAKSLSERNFTGLTPISVKSGPIMPCPFIAEMKSPGDPKSGAPIVMPWA